MLQVDDSGMVKHKSRYKTRVKPEFLVRLQLDFALTVSTQLSTLDSMAIRYHVLSRDYEILALHREEKATWPFEPRDIDQPVSKNSLGLQECPSERFDTVKHIA